MNAVMVLDVTERRAGRRLIPAVSGTFELFGPNDGKLRLSGETGIGRGRSTIGAKLSRDETI